MPTDATAGFRAPEETPPVAEAIAPRTGWSALLTGVRSGFHPQVLLAWVVALWLPTVAAALPATLWLYLQAGHSPHAAATAASATFLADALDGMPDAGVVLGASTGFALLLALLLSPWLNGMILAQVRSGDRLRLGATLRAGLAEYPRMLRMLAWSLLLVGIAVAIGSAAIVGIEALALRFAATDEGLVPTPAGWFLPALLALLVHATIEAGRGQLGADPGLRSVVVAWRRGLALLLQRPGATMLVYLGTSGLGIGLALGFLRMRALLDSGHWPGWLLAWACAQLAVAALAWGRSARLHGLADLAAGALAARAAQAADRGAGATRIG
jgi:hypothetical protein